jgi:hypothetical protein
MIYDLLLLPALILRDGVQDKLVKESKYEFMRERERSLLEKERDF